jgi:hypothetical protein
MHQDLHRAVPLHGPPFRGRIARFGEHESSRSLAKRIILEVALGEGAALCGSIRAGRDHDRRKQDSEHTVQGANVAGAT